MDGLLQFGVNMMVLTAFLLFGAWILLKQIHRTEHWRKGRQTKGSDRGSDIT